MSVDITLFGATGFTGALTAEHLGTHLPDGATWAVAGRSAGKLAGVADRVERAGGVRPEVVVADVGDDTSMRAMAEGTRVLVTTVGPYLQHGEAAVKAAAEAGIGYLDLTGEPQFVDEMWLKYHDVAVRTGATLVHACGFDSIPYDLGVLHVVSELPDDVPVQIKAYVRANGGVSGGTFHSAVNQFSSWRHSGTIAQQRREREARPTGRRVKGGGSFGRTPFAPGWAVPLPTLDPQIVLRSARALDTYGPDFRYEHFARIKSTAVLAAGAVGVGMIGVGSQVPPLKRLLLKAIDPGAGPSDERRAKGWYTVDLLASAGGRDTHTRLHSDKDPGYDGTAEMLAEAALCMAFDHVPTRVPGQSTTAVAFGQPLIDRLLAGSWTFTTR